MTQPIVFLGGFLSSPGAYRDMQQALAQITGQAVWIVEARSYDWLGNIVPAGWAHLLRKLDRTVQRARRNSTTGKVTLIGHSAGGILGRLYLSPRPFLGRAYKGQDYVAHLITLGSPHYNQRRLIYGGWLSKWVNERYPGAFFAPPVRYTSVAGKLIRGDRYGSRRERQSYAFYKNIIGDGNVWGDGLIPVPSALLEGSHQITLDGVSHFKGFGGPWYGEPEVIGRWWKSVGLA